MARNRTEVIESKFTLGLVTEATELFNRGGIFYSKRIGASPKYMYDVEDDLEENEIIIRRVISSDGRSRAFINNKPVTAQLLRDLGALTLNIHGQHAHQLLGLKDKDFLHFNEA